MDCHPLTHQETPADEIIPGVWLGNQASSADKDFLKENNITLIINATPNFPNWFNTNPEIKYVRIPIQNRDEPIMRTVFDETIEEALQEIRQNAANGGNTLVHCKSGHTRSATVVALFLVSAIDQFTLQNARDHIQSIRPTALNTKPYFYPPLQPLGRWRSKSYGSDYKNQPLSPEPEMVLS